MKYVIVGNSVAGINAAEAIRTEDEKGSITILSAEKEACYSRPLTTYYLSGQLKEEDILYRSMDFYEKKNIRLISGKKVTRIKPQEKKVVLSDKSELSYRKLLLATGGSPSLPDIPGIRSQGVYTLRTLEEARKISKQAKKTKRVIFLGGGLVSLRTAYALHKRGLKITLIVGSQQILSQNLDGEGAKIVRKLLEEQGWEILVGRKVKEIIVVKNGDSKGKVQGIVLDSGEKLKGEMVIVGKGVQPETKLGQDVGIKTNRGILVGRDMQTSAKNIYAAGDVAEAYDIAREKASITAIWPNAAEQGRIAGLNMAGKKETYAGGIGMNSFEFFGLPCVTLGIVNPPLEAKEYEVITKAVPQEKIYKKVVLKEGIIKGAILVGEINRAGVITGLIKDRMDVSHFKEDILEEGFGLMVFPKMLRKKKILEKTGKLPNSKFQ